MQIIPHTFEETIFKNVEWVPKMHKHNFFAQSFNRKFVHMQSNVNNFQVAALTCIANDTMHLVHDQNFLKV